MARLIPAAVAATLALAVAGCSPSSDSSSTDAGSPTRGEPGTLDCSALDDATLQTYSIGIQFLAQIRGQDQVDLINDATVDYDPDAMEAVLLSLRGLAGHGVEGLGDPGDDIDFYLGANDKARDILAVDGAVPQSMFDDLVDYEGEIAEFLAHQVSINAALSENCP